MDDGSVPADARVPIERWPVRGRGSALGTECRRGGNEDDVISGERRLRGVAEPKDRKPVIAGDETHAGSG